MDNGQQKGNMGWIISRVLGCTYAGRPERTTAAALSLVSLQNRRTPESQDAVLWAGQGGTGSGGSGEGERGQGEGGDDGGRQRGKELVASKQFYMILHTILNWSNVRCIQTLANVNSRTYIQTINDDFVDGILISCHSCGNLLPVPQPHILALKDEGGVAVELVVQDHIEAIACKEADDKHQAIKGGGKCVQVVAADAFCYWR